MNDELKQIMERLAERSTRQPLSPQKVWDQSLTARIENLELPGKDHDAGVIALVAALHLKNDDLVVSHGYAQDIEHDATGAYWHGIMHRMEQDYPNASYWFMRAGNHPVMERVKQRVAERLQQEENVETLATGHAQDIILEFQDLSIGWTPQKFVELVKLQENGHSSTSEQTRRVLEQIQHIEMSALFDYTMDLALE